MTVGDFSEGEFCAAGEFAFIPVSSADVAEFAATMKQRSASDNAMLGAVGTPRPTFASWVGHGVPTAPFRTKTPCRPQNIVHGIISGAQALSIVSLYMSL